jgi:hypothetical protein
MEVQFIDMFISLSYQERQRDWPCEASATGVVEIYFL